MSSNYYRLVKDYPDLEYRNSEESALFLVKLVNSLFQIEDNYNIPTSILLYWGFCWEADEDEFFVGKRELTTAGNIPKPIQTGFEMLSRLKENRIRVSRDAKDSRFGLIATASNENTLALITYNYDETDDDFEQVDGVSENIKGLIKGQKYHVRITKLDRQHNNTYRVWQKIGQPETSVGTDIRLIRRAGELQQTDEFEVTSDENGSINLNLQLHRHSMQLIELDVN